MNDKDLLIKIEDKYGECLADKSFQSISKRNIPKGFVEIYEIDKKNDSKKLIGKNNLVVYLGREWLISRAFNQANENITPVETEYISWFGVGDGGASIADPFNPTSPTNIDTDLSNPIMINVSDASCGDYRTTPDVGYYKHPFDSIEYEQDSDNYNHWLISRISITLGADDANDFNLNEAGLYTASSNAGAYVGPFNLYARVTFPTIVKNSSRQLLFVWYVFF